MSWAMANTPNVEYLCEYELKINELMRDCRNLTGVCFYDRRIFPSDMLMRVLTVHPQVGFVTFLFYF